MGCMFPKADDLAGYWANIRQRRDAITEVPATHWRPEDYYDADPKAPDRTYARRGGFLTPVDFPPLDFGIAPNNLDATDTTQLLGLMVARKALEDAGYGEGSTRPLDRDRVSVILGVTGTLELVIPLGARLGHPIWRRALKASGVPEDQAEEVVQRISDSYVGWQENSFPGLLGNVAAGRIANRLDLGGTNCVIDAACASSFGAVSLAALELASGRCDMALTGGLDTFNDIFMFMCFSKTPALSPRGDARPFDAGCDGTALGEGLGVLALKRLDDARRDGDKVYAVIRSVGSSSDGKGNAVYAPKAGGQARALRQAYRLAGFGPETVELVEAHGTGTKVGDATELAALNEVYGAAKPGSTWCALGSVKSQIGHTKAAAGVAGLIKAAMALHHKVLPPTIKVTNPVENLGPGRSPFYLNTEARPWLPRPDHPRRAAVSAFGFGGSNFHCVLEEAEPVRASADWDGETQILAFSADRPAGLLAAIDAWPSGLDWRGLRSAAARSRETFKTTDPHRLVLVADAETDLPALFDRARAAVDPKTANGSRVKAREGVFVGAGPAPGKLAMVFPGQGSQYVGMLRELACVFPEVQDALALADEPDGDAETRLSDRIYPFPAFNDADRSAHERALRSTEIAQPAIGAVSLGVFRLLEGFGLRPDVVAGHSFGELTALCASGRIDVSTFVRLSRERGRLMAAQTGGGGSMLAVLAAREVVDDVLQTEGLDGPLVIANKNAPRQFVLSGPAEAIARAAKAFEQRKVTARPLAVAAAFHSPDVAAASGPFLEALKGASLSATSTVPVYANATASAYPADPDEARALLAGQIARPVEFVAEIEAMADLGVGVFLEVGPDAKLTGLVRSILEGKPVRSLALDASRGERGNLADLASALAELAALGYPVSLTRWDDPSSRPAPPDRKPGLTVKVSGANHAPRPPANPTPPAAPLRSARATESKPKSTSNPTPNPNRISPASASPPMTPTFPPRTPPAPLPPSDPTPHVNGRNGRTVDVRSHHAAPHANGQAPQANGSAAIVPGDPGLIAQALRTAQENLVALQALGEQTAALHRQFLEGQDRTQRTFQSLLEQQQRLTLGSLGMVTAAPVPLPIPASAPSAPVRRVEPHPEPVVVSAPVMATPPAPSATVVKSTQTLAVLTEVVSEKTGYPAEMLEPTMQLDADLGIDSIKRVEILSALQERLPDAPVIKPEHLGTLRTLSDIVVFLGGKVSEPAPASSANVENTLDVQAVLLEVVAEKTGYPAEMLEPTMQLDADLGIDSIKRVEILSALQERLPDAPVIKPEHLGTLRTLSDIAGFLGGPGGGATTQAVVAKVVDTQAILLEVVSEKTGYPAEMLEPTMQLDADLGIDSIKRVEILSALQERLPDAPVIKPEHLGTLRTLSDIAGFLDGGTSDASRVTATVKPSPAEKVTDAPVAVQRLVVRASAIAASPETPLPTNAEIWVTDDGSGLSAAVAARLSGRGYRAKVIGWDDSMGNEALDALVLIAPQTPETGDEVVAQAFRWLRAAGPALRASNGLAMTVTRLDGSFGLNGLAEGSDPVAGGLAGLIKTAGHEWSEVRCKAVDLDPALGASDEAVTAVVNALFQDGPPEVGLSSRGKVTPTLTAEPVGPPGESSRIEPSDLVVITGGARGVTAEVALALAEAFQPTLVLLGRSVAPEAEPDWLVACTGEPEIKRALAAHAKGRATPQAIGDQYRKVAANREILRNLGRIEATGAKALYRQVDSRDPAALAAVVAAARQEFGPVRGLVHGAGVLADRAIIDQTDAQFADVYSTKVDGLRALLDAAGSDPLAMLVVFSSSTARFGRSGQVAYAAANEVLNKIAQREARCRPGCKVVSVNWGPWDGGMVTPALRPLFASEGIGLIPLREGARFLVDEIRSSAEDVPVEIVVLGPGSIHPAAESVAPRAPEVPRSANLTTVFERLLDPETMPVLRSHVIDGRAVLPMALTLEWLAQGALQRNPGLAFRGVESLRLLKGAVVRDDEPETVAILAGKGVRDSSGVYRVPVELQGVFPDGKTIAHARGEVILGDRPASADRPAINPVGWPAYGRSLRSVYHEVLFHGPDLHGLERIEACTIDAVSAWVKTAPSPSAWVDRPLRQAWLSDPLVLDSAFQLLVLWSAEHAGAPSLPTALGRYTQFCRAFPAPRVHVVARVRRPSPLHAVADFEFLDATGALLARLDGYECVANPSLLQAFRRNRLPRVARSPR